MTHAKLKEKQFFLCETPSVWLIAFGKHQLVDSESQSSLKYFMPSMCSPNCANTLQWTTVAYSLSLLYYSQFLASKDAKYFSVQFSTVLYFNLSIEEENVFFVLLSFFTLLKDKGQPK